MCQLVQCSGILFDPLVEPQRKHIYIYFNYLFIYLFILAVLCLRFCARASSSCGKWGPLFIAVRGPLTIAASLVVEHRLQTRRLSSCGARAQLLRGMWDLPRPGLEPVSSALAGRFSTTAPPGKPRKHIFNNYYNFSYHTHAPPGHNLGCSWMKCSPLRVSRGLPWWHSG